MVACESLIIGFQCIVKLPLKLLRVVYKYLGIEQKFLCRNMMMYGHKEQFFLMQIAFHKDLSGSLRCGSCELVMNDVAEQGCSNPVPISKRDWPTTSWAMSWRFSLVL